MRRFSKLHAASMASTTVLSRRRFGAPVFLITMSTTARHAEQMCSLPSFFGMPAWRHTAHTAGASDGRSGAVAETMHTQVGAEGPGRPLLSPSEPATPGGARSSSPMTRMRCEMAGSLREAAGPMMEEDTDVDINMRLLVLVLNLERRHDRREWMERTLCVESGDKLGFVQACDGSVPALARHHHGFVFTPCANWALSASELGDLEKRWTEELGYTAPDAGDLAEFYGRDLTAGEVACFATHHAAWVSAAPRLGVTAPGAASAHMTRWQAASVGEEWVAVVLEDDVTVLPCEEPRLHVHAARWRSVWNALRAQLTALRERKLPWFISHPLAFLRMCSLAVFRFPHILECTHKT